MSFKLVSNTGRSCFVILCTKNVNYFSLSKIKLNPNDIFAWNIMLCTQNDKLSAQDRGHNRINCLHDRISS